MDHLQRSILKRLFLAWLLLSLAALAGATLYSAWQLNQLVKRAVHAEFQRISPVGADLDATGLFIQVHFSRLRLYDRRGHLLRESLNPSFPIQPGHWEPKLQELPRDGHPHIHTFEVQRRSLVQWLLPLHRQGDPEVGYLEGVMLLDQGAMQVLKTSVRASTISILLSVAATALLLYPLMLSLNRRVYRFADEVLKGNIEIASVLGAAIAQRDSDTGHHNYRVTLYAIRLAEALHSEQVDMRALIMGAFLHDVGKIGIRDAILLKPGPLSPEEFETIRTHVKRGIDIVHPSHWLIPARDVIAHHHEKYDGSGYGHGLLGEAIPLVARIFAIVDVFDALTSHRPYKTAMSCQEALELMKLDSGKHFDPGILDVFLTLAEGLQHEVGQASEVELIAKLLRVVERYRLQTLKEEGSSRTRR